MKTPFNKTYQSQQKKLIPSTFKKGIISAVNLNSFSADVMFIGNQQTIIKNIPFASTVNINNVKVGDRCKVDLFDETNPNDMCIAYTYGRSFLRTSNTGIATITTSGIAIPHGLGTVPNSVGFLKQSSPNTSLSVTGGGGGTYFANIDVYEYSPPDSTNIYLKSVNGIMIGNWYAATI